MCLSYYFTYCHCNGINIDILAKAVQKALYDNEYIVEAKVIPPMPGFIPTVVEADAVYSEGAPVLQLKGNYSYGETIALPYASMKTEHITLDLKTFVQINTARLYFTCNRFCISDAMG